MNRVLAISSARRRPLVAGAVAMICLAVVVVASTCGQVVHALAYLAALVAAVVVVDLLAPQPDAAAPVRRPALETTLAVGASLVGAAALTWRFTGPPSGGPGRLAFVALVLLFVFPIALAACLLFVLRYRPRELGLRLRGPACAPAVLAVIAAAAFLGAPENVLWGRMWRELGPRDFITLELAD